MEGDVGSGAVSPDLQAWATENVFVVGASVYPSHASYKPQVR
jgi:choline dehydrogenase-like flavoprotein